MLNVLTSAFVWALSERITRQIVAPGAIGAHHLLRCWIPGSPIIYTLAVPQQFSEWRL